MALLGAGLAVGPPLGIASVVAFSFVMVRVFTMFGARISMKNMFAVVAYAGVPMILSLVFVFPVELAIFGIALFQNPSPMAVQPVVYATLLGMHLLAVVWFWTLIVDGIIVSGGFTRRRALYVAAGVMSLTCACAVALHFV
jgi:hypothetical protein